MTLSPRRTFLVGSTALALAGFRYGGSPSQRAAAAPFDTDNPTIQQARQTALALLQPSDRDLQHGYELHRQSLVFESYGFAPRAAIDGDAFAAAMKSGATDEELADLREEMSMTGWAKRPEERAEFLQAMQASGVTCIFQNCGEEGNDPLRLIKRLARFTYSTDHERATIFKAVLPKEVVEAKKDGRLCLAFTTNGVPLHHAWESVRDELRWVRIFQQLGVWMMHLTYNRRNPLGDGAGEPNDGGVSEFGKHAIAELNRLGVIVDVAHSGWRTSREAALASAKPIVASHTTCGGLYSHFRGKPDDTLKAICDRDGLFGICCIPRFLGGTGDIRALLDHIDYGIKRFGANHVAIGTDVAYVSRNDAAERAKIPKRNSDPRPKSPLNDRWEHLWPEDTYRATSDGERSLSWVNWPLFTVGMVQRGHSDETIQKILGLNVLRVWQANLTP